MKLDIYRLHDDAPEIVPGRPDRAWMDATQERFAYRCLPLSIANTSGWEILSPFDFTIFWNGGPRKDDIRFESQGDPAAFARFCLSHFAHGVVTFHVGYMFRTSPGWAMWAMGPPNSPKHGIQALAGLVETDWLPFPFTMNWLMTAPGKVSFEKGEPVAFVSPVLHEGFEEIEPVLKNLNDAPELLAQYREWSTSRATFLERLAKGDAETVRESWQRHYFRGRRPDDPTPVPTHVHKRRLKPVT
jgi:hypothetical protein